GVGVVERARVAEAVGEQGLAPLDVPVDRLRVRVEQQLRRVAAQPGRRLVRAVHPVAVPLAGADPGQVAVPDQPVALRKVDPLLLPVLVEQAQLDAVGDLGEDGEVGATPVELRSQRVGRARPDVQAISLVGGGVPEKFYLTRRGTTDYVTRGGRPGRWGADVMVARPRRWVRVGPGGRPCRGRARAGPPGWAARRG